MQDNILTFIIPVKHPANAEDWNQVKLHLGETIRSIDGQDRTGWKAVIVANHGAELPDLPGGFEVKRVDFPPNQLYRQSLAEAEAIEALRIDKGRRVLAGMLHAGDMGHVMVVDDDDLISRRLTSFVAANRLANGWYVREGLIWHDGSRLLYRFKDFSRLCGTSHIVRADLYKLPPDFDSADETCVRRMLGSHIYLKDDLEACGTPLVPLPFVGAVYRTGHAESWGRFRGISKFFVRERLLLDPRKLYRRISRVRIKTHRIEKEFFGL
jgi:hypothetical protein